MNKSDSERFTTRMEELGYRESRSKYETDFVIINTCGVRQKAEDRIYGFIPSIKKRNKKVKIIITGCLVYRKDVRKRLNKQVDYWIPIQQISNFQLPISKQNEKNNLSNYLKIQPKYSSKFSAFVPVGNGCNNFCTYCVVPYARGRETYRPIKDILNEVKYLVKNGYKEIILIAQNVNSYRVKSGQKTFDFADLLQVVNDIEGKFLISFLTSHPKDMTDKLIKTVAECEKVYKYIHLPAQAGDNAVLRKMNRNYTISHYKKLIKKIKQLMPEASISTDIIVGFPGETKKQFNNTVKLFKETKYDMAYISQYSSRPGTTAEKLDDNVSKCEKKKREDVLTKILKKTVLENNKKYINKIVKVLVGAKNKKGEWYGKTETNKSVKFKMKESSNLIGKFTDIKILKAKDFNLEGKFKKA